MCETDTFEIVKQKGAKPFGRFLTLSRLARLADCDRSVILRLLNAGKIQPDEVLESGHNQIAMIFRRERVEEVKQILAEERAK